jgi:hypothetical protein
MPVHSQPPFETCTSSSCLRTVNTKVNCGAGGRRTFGTRSARQCGSHRIRVDLLFQCCMTVDESVKLRGCGAVWTVSRSVAMMWVVNCVNNCGVGRCGQVSECHGQIMMHASAEMRANWQRRRACARVCAADGHGYFCQWVNSDSQG